MRRQVFYSIGWSALALYAMLECGLLAVKDWFLQIRRAVRAQQGRIRQC